MFFFSLSPPPAPPTPCIIMGGSKFHFSSDNECNESSKISAIQYIVYTYVTSYLLSCVCVLDVHSLGALPSHFSQTWIAMFRNFGSINWSTVLLSAIAIFFLIVFKILNKLLKSPKVPKVPVKVYRRTERKWITKRFTWPVPIPSQLIVVSEVVFCSAAQFSFPFHMYAWWRRVHGTFFVWPCIHTYYR